MYCPDCGAETSVDLKFCRSCGLGLEKIAQSLVEQLPTKLDSLRARKNNLERVGRVARNLFLLATLSFCLFVLGYLLTQGNFIGALVFFGIIAFVSCGLMSLFLFEKAKGLEKGSTIRQLGGPGGLTQNGTDIFTPEKLLKSLVSVSQLKKVIYTVKLSDVIVRLDKLEKIVDITICFEERRETRRRAKA